MTTLTPAPNPLLPSTYIQWPSAQTSQEEGGTCLGIDVLEVSVTAFVSSFVKKRTDPQVWEPLSGLRPAWQGGRGTLRLSF